MITLKVEWVGDRLCVPLSEEAARLLGAQAGEAVQISRTAGGELSLSAVDQEHAARQERSRALLRRYRRTFEALDRPPE